MKNWALLLIVIVLVGAISFAAAQTQQPEQANLEVNREAPATDHEAQVAVENLMSDYKHALVERIQVQRAG